MKKKLSVFVLITITAMFAGCKQNTQDLDAVDNNNNKEEQVAKPVPGVADGYKFPAGGGTVSFTCATEGAAIYYTKGSGTPNLTYTSPVSVTEAVTFRVQAKKAGMTDSDILIVSYTREPSQIMQFASSMKIGWNLGNALDGHNNLMPSDGAWQSGRQVTQALINAIAAQGFDTVRIPVTWGQKLHTQLRYSVSDANFTLTVPQIETLTLDAAWLDKVAQVVGWVNDAGMKAIINIHHDGADSSHWLSVKNEHLTGANKQKIDAIYKTLWTQIANRFKNTGDFLLFEAFNELHDGNWSDGSSAQRSRVNELSQIFVNTVRAAGGENTNRYLVIAGYVTRPSVTVSSLVMPADPTPQRIFVSIHFYDPYDFTLAATQTVWGSKALSNWGNESNVQNVFNNVKNKFVNNGIPVIIGEYGATRLASAEGKAHRKYYMEYVTKYAHDCGFIPIYWDNGGSGSGKESSGLFNRASPHGLLTDAADIIAVMMKAAKEDYLLSSITPP
jgi:aryl-phospho-beta-D-glucosidase BglC (GH1 family)